MNSPCYNCKTRRPGCHSGCADYEAWIANTRQEEKARRDAVLEYRGEQMTRKRKVGQK